MNTENIIKIKGGSYTAVKKALRQWIDIYADKLDNSWTFQVFKNGQGNHVIKVDKNLENEHFFYLVNYIKYPDNIDYKVDVEGFTIGKNQKEIADKKLLIYIPENDKEFDSVYAVTKENKAYKIDFGGKLKEIPLTKKYISSNVNGLLESESLKVRRKKIVEDNQEDLKAKTDKRFKILSTIILIAIAISNLILLNDMKLFVQVTFFIGIGISVWFFSDYKMLRIDKYYFLSIMISLLYLGYGFFLKNTLTQPDIKLIDLGSLFAISFLIVQRPIRLVFKLIFKREPVIGNYPAPFWDLAYTIILFISFMLILFLVADLIK